MGLDPIDKSKTQILQFVTNGETDDTEAFFTQLNDAEIKYLVKLTIEETENGNAWAMCVLGDLYYYGIGVEQSIDNAINYYNKAAEKNHPIAYCFLGRVYRNDEYVYKDNVKAKYWFEQAIQQNYLEAYRDLADLYFEGGDGIEQDYTKAFECLQRGADQGNISAQEDLACMHLMGKGTEKNVNEAFRLFKSIAEKSPYATFSVGQMLLYREIEGTIEETVEWLTKSAEDNNKEAQYELGHLYLIDVRVKNLTSAIKWLCRSRDNGYGLAIELLKDEYLQLICELMTENDILKKQINVLKEENRNLRPTSMITTMI